MSNTGTDLVSTDPLGPVRRPHTVSRRSVLGGLGLGSLAALVAPMFGPAPTAAAEPSRPKGKHRQLADDGSYVPLTPYVTEASCELTEDYFLTDEVLIDEDDQILPFRNTANGMTEAVVVTGGQLAHLRRDPSATSGWSYQVIDATPFSGVSGAAVTSSSTHNAMIMAVGATSTNAKDPMGACQLALAADGVTWTCPSNGWLDWQLAGPIGAGVTGAGDIYWYGWTAAATSKNLVYNFYRWDGMGDNPGIDQTKQVTTLGWPKASAITPVAANLLLDATVGNGTQSYAVVMSSTAESSKNGYVVQAYRIDETNPIAVGSSNAGAAALIWSHVGTTGSVTAPAMLWQSTDGDLHFVDETGAQANLFTASGSDPVSAGHVAAWQVGGEYTFAIRDSTSTVSVVSQFGSGGSSGFTSPIPLLTGIERIYGVPTDPDEGTLFAVDLDASLSVLTYGSTGWTQNVVHQPAAAIQEVTSWRCQITVTDANGIAVSGAGVQIGTDRPVALWQEGETSGGATTVVPGTPATLTCDASGQLIFSLPANEIDAAQLTAQVLDSSNKPAGQPLTVAPDSDVHAFLSGIRGLDSVGQLNGGTLAAAQSTSWDTATQTYVNQGALLPGIANLSGSQQTTAADAVAASMVHITSLPTSTPAAASDVRSACLDLSATAPSFATSADPGHFTSSATGDQTWWARAEHDVKSVFHGLRHGAIHLQRLISSWDDDAKQWGLNLIITLEDDVQHLINYVVHTAEDAIHAISSLIHALGADIEKFWHWLKNLVLGIFSAAEKGAKVMEAWIQDLTQQLDDVIDAAKSEIDTDFFSNLETKVDGWFTDLESKAGITIGGAAPQPAPAPDTGSGNSGINWKEASEAVTVLQHCSPMYWLNKLKKHLPGTPADGGPSLTVDITQDLADVIAAFDAAVSTVDAIATTVVDTFGFMTKGKDALESTELATILTDLENVVVDILTLLDAVVDAVLDLVKTMVDALDDLFSYEFPALHVLQELLDLAGIDTTLSIQHLLCLTAAFPTAVVYRAMGYQGDMFPPQTDDSGAVEAWGSQFRAAVGRHNPELGDSAFQDPWGAALNGPSMFIQFAWTINDGYVDSVAEPPTVPVIIDTVAPVLLSILGWPSQPISTKLAGWPFRGGVDKTSTDWGLIPAVIIANFVPAIFNLINYRLGKSAVTAETKKKFNDYAVPLSSFGSGLVASVLGGTWAGRNGDGFGIAEAVVGNLSYLFGIAGLPSMRDNEIIRVAKIIGDALANLSTAILYGEAWSEAM